LHAILTNVFDFLECVSEFTVCQANHNQPNVFVMMFAQKMAA